MVKELVKPPIDHLSEDAVETCGIIDSFIDNNDVDEFNVNVEQDGVVNVSIPDPVGVSFTFSV